MSGLLVRPEPTSAGFVRRQLAQDLAAQRLTQASIEDAVLVASELVGNAVRHAAAAADDHLGVSWTIDGDEIVVSVVDGSSQMPQQRDADPADISGRGLAIVDAIATQWGVEPTPSGKRVWARVPIQR